MEKSQINRKWRVLFAGTPAYAVPSLESLYALPGCEVVGVLTQKAKPRGRGKVIQPSPVEAFATAHNILVLSPERLAAPESLALLASLQADVGVVVAYGKILPPQLLTALPYGWINAHASLLPRWRGASPIQQALLAGDAVTGVTLMQLDAGMDTGPILAEESVQIPPRETAVHLAETLSIRSAHLLRANLHAYLQGTLLPRNQPTTGVTLAPQITKSNGFLSLAEPADVLERKVRAYTPWPGATLRYNALDLKVLEATVQPGAVPAGHVVPAPTGMAFGTAKDLFVPLRVQVAGKRPMPSAEFVRGYSKQLFGK